jgi:hypothetical protein
MWLGASIALLFRSPDLSQLRPINLPLAYLPSLLTLLFLAWGIREAMRSAATSRLFRSRALGLTLVGAAALIAAFYSPVALPVWFWYLCALGVLLVLISLLELWHSPLFATGANPILLPLGAFALAIALGVGLGTSARASTIVLLGGLQVAPFTLSWFWPIAVLIVALIFVAIAWRRAKTKRDKRVEHLRQWIDERVNESREARRQDGADDDVTVHAIAHSFGTFLLGQVLKKQVENGPPKKTIRINRIILVGSVLDTGFPWNQLPAVDGRIPFKQVRNEVGGRDRVVEWAGRTQLRPFKSLLGSIGFGAAGRQGFTSEEVHNVNNSLDYCEHCRTREEREAPRVHNVHLPFFHHSDAFAVLERAERFWLPFLLGIDAWEYWDFRRLCVKAMAYTETLKECEQEIAKIESAMEVNNRDYNLAASADASQREEKQREFQQKLDENAKRRVQVDRRVVAVGVQLQTLERQMGEQVWDWAYATQSGNERFSDCVRTAIAEKLFKDDPSLADGGEKRDEVLKYAEGLSPKVIKAMWGLVVESLRAVERLKKRELRPEDKDPIARLNPYTALTDSIALELKHGLK